MLEDQVEPSSTGAAGGWCRVRSDLRYRSGYTTLCEHFDALEAERNVEMNWWERFKRWLVGL